MMNKRRFKNLRAIGWLAPVILLGPQRGEARIFGINDLNTFLVSTEAYSSLGAVAADGDFNEDGYADVAIVQDILHLGLSHGVTSIDLLFGGPTLQGQSALSENLKSRILFPWDKYQGGSVLFADLNGGGDDLIFFGYGKGVPSKMFVFFGSNHPPSTLDLRLSSADLEITVNTNTPHVQNKCDFNGDGFEDLVVGESNFGDVFLLLGRPVFSTPTFALSSEPSVIRFHLDGSGNLGGNLACGDFNGDGKSDLALSAPDQGVGPRLLGGEVYIIWGSTHCPLLWNLGSKAADVAIVGPSAGAGFRCPVAGDFTGDGKSDLIGIDRWENGGVILDGAALSSGPSSFDMSTGIPGHPSSEFKGLPYFDSQVPQLLGGDFDGDGKADFFTAFDDQVNGFLSNDFSGQALAPPPAFQFLVPFDQSLGDINGDGKKDLVVLPLGGPNGSVGIIYGYHPLDNPSIQVRGNPSLPKAVLYFSVEGEPVEMNLSGDFIEPINGKWVPYQTSLPITFSQTSGEKQLTVLFRNSYGRESVPTIKTLSLDPGSSRLEVVNNVFVSGGSRVRVDCRLAGPSRVKASVYDQSGEFLAAILDGDLGAGVWPLEWDGANASGRSVVPGIYYMVVEIDGHVQKQKILVQD